MKCFARCVYDTRRRYFLMKLAMYCYFCHCNIHPIAVMDRMVTAIQATQAMFLICSIILAP